MRSRPLLLLAGLACSSTAPRGPLDGTWLGTYGSNDLSVTLQQHDAFDSTLTGTWHVVTGASRYGAIQSVVRGSDLIVTVTFSDSCGGTATGVWTIDAVDPGKLKGTLSGSDCSGSFAGSIALQKAPQNI